MQSSTLQYFYLSACCWGNGSILLLIPVLELAYKQQQYQDALPKPQAHGGITLTQVQFVILRLICAMELTSKQFLAAMKLEDEVRRVADAFLR